MRSTESRRHSKHMLTEKLGLDELECTTQPEKSIAKGGVTTPFPWKLHNMLDAMDARDTKHIVGWQPHGRSFMVNKPKEFVTQVMNQFFNQSKYASFQRQLNLYGFSRLSHGRDKGAYFHKCFIRGERQLCRGMIRQKIKGTKVRRSLAPEEEPNFYSAEYNHSYGNQVISPDTPDRDVVSMAVLSHTDTPRLLSPSPQPQKTLQLEHSVGDQTSLVSLIHDSQAPNSYIESQAVVPTPPLIKTLHSHQVSDGGLEFQDASARGGDLLFFEGQPFRYLESAEEAINKDAAAQSATHHVIPPASGYPASSQQPPTLHASPTRNCSSQDAVPSGYRDSLHDMISSIVSMDAPWTETQSRPGNVCSV